MIEQLAAMPRYEAYKDSGVEWLGEIPAHWELSKLGSCLKPVSIKNRPDLPLLSITREKGVIQRNIEDPDENHNYIPDDLSNYKVLERGQFGMNKMKAWQGSYGVSDHTGIVSPAYFIFAFTKEIDSKFFHLAIRSGLYISYFGSASDGVRIGQWDLSKPRMKEIPFLIPPIPEQTIIATFLDQKTAQIDQAVAIKEKQITLLKERKQILIQNVVTRGLNPDAPMRDSGVEWIGEMPSHWSMVPIRRLVDVRDGTHDTPEYIEISENSRYLITSKDFYDGEIRVENAKSISIKDYDEISKRSKVDIGDVLMSMIGGNIGKSVLINEFNEFSIKNVALFKTHGDLGLAKYILFYLASGLLEKQIQLNSRGGAQGFLSLGDVRNLIFFKIPPQEQATIVAHIETESAKIDQAISIQQQQIDKLKEYKATLINSAVTGKIKVA